MSWQPIETAPKDGEVILVYVKFGDDPEMNGFSLAWWSEEENSFVLDFESGDEFGLTHWMPLPEPPQ